MKSLAVYTGKALEVLVVTILSCLVFINVFIRYGFNRIINIT